MNLYRIKCTYLCEDQGFTSYYIERDLEYIVAVQLCDILNTNPDDSTEHYEVEEDDGI